MVRMPWIQVLSEHFEALLNQNTSTCSRALVNGWRSKFIAEREERAAAQQQQLLEDQVSDARMLSQLLAGQALPCDTCSNCLL